MTLDHTCNQLGISLFNLSMFRLHRHFLRIPEVRTFRRRLLSYCLFYSRTSNSSTAKTQHRDN